MPWPCGGTWYGPSCGERYWHEWFSHKPECCEPCGCCGQHYTGCHTRWVQGGVAEPCHPNAWQGSGDYLGDMDGMHYEELPPGAMSQFEAGYGEPYDPRPMEYSDAPYGRGQQGPPHMAAAPRDRQAMPARFENPPHAQPLRR